MAEQAKVAMPKVTQLDLFLSGLYQEKRSAQMKITIDLRSGLSLVLSELDSGLAFVRVLETWLERFAKLKAINSRTLPRLMYYAHSRTTVTSNETVMLKLAALHEKYKERLP